MRLYRINRVSISFRMNNLCNKYTLPMIVYKFEIELSLIILIEIRCTEYFHVMCNQKQSNYSNVVYLDIHYQLNFKSQKIQTFKRREKNIFSD